MKRKILQALVLAGLAAPCLPQMAAAQSTHAIRDVMDAKAAFAQKDWSSALPLLEEIAGQSPDNGTFQLMLATTQFHRGDYEAAIGHYDRALELGADDPAKLNYQIATCRIMLLDRAGALAALKTAISLGYRDLEAARGDPAFAPLRGDPAYRDLLGIADPAKLTRNDGWRSDIRFLAEWVEKKSYHPFRTMTGDRAASGARLTQEEFERAVTRLSAQVPMLSDIAIQVALIRLIASLGDGHTELAGLPPHGAPALTLPLAFYIFDDGVHVISAAPQYRTILGARVTAIDGKPIAEVLPRLEDLIARDNSMWLSTMEPLLLRQLGFLKELGIARVSTAVTLSLEKDGQKIETEVVADTTEPNIWNMLPKPPGWAWIGDASQADFQRGNDKPFWMRWDMDDRLLYVQYNNIFNAPNQSLADFAKQLGDVIAAEPVEKLVIDMRNNNGGNTYLNEPLLKVVENAGKVNRPGHLYVIVGRRTFSAAMNAVSYFGKYTDAVFVGEPTGGKPNAPGDETFFTLPYSGLLVNLSDRYWQGSWPDDFSNWRAPDIAVPVRFSDYAAGRDAALDLIKAQRLPD